MFGTNCKKCKTGFVTDRPIEEPYECQSCIEKRKDAPFWMAMYIFIALFVGFAAVYLARNLVPVREYGTITETKNVVSDKLGRIKYYTIIRMDDGGYKSVEGLKYYVSPAGTGYSETNYTLK